MVRLASNPPDCLRCKELKPHASPPRRSCSARFFTFESISKGAKKACAIFVRTRLLTAQGAKPALGAREERTYALRHIPPQAMKQSPEINFEAACCSCVASNYWVVNHPANQAFIHSCCKIKWGFPHDRQPQNTISSRENNALKPPRVADAGPRRCMGISFRDNKICTVL